MGLMIFPARNLYFVYSVFATIMLNRPIAHTAFLLGTFISCAQNPTSEKYDLIDKLMNTYAAYHKFNGTVLVAERGHVFYKKGFGFANAEWEMPNEPDTKMRLGSMTKPFTAVVVLKLVQQGKLDLFEPIKTYLPEYPKPASEQITLHHLLTHSSGIPNFTSGSEYRKTIMRHKHTPEELVRLFSDLPLEFAPGEKFAYSNSGYSLLGYIIERVSGKSYEACLQEDIFKPLRMINTGYDHNETAVRKRASGYYRIGTKLINADFIDMSVPFAAGAIYSTAEDLYLFDQALYTDVLLPDRFRKMLFARYYPAGPKYYGYGWFNYSTSGLRRNRTHTIQEHSGGINGFSSLLIRMPEDKHLVVLLDNTGAQLNEISRSIQAILYDRDFEMPNESLAHVAAEIVKRDGLAAAMTKLKELKNSGRYSVSEIEFNAVGYEFLQEQKMEEAIEFFKFNVETFPHSSNTYDSLGEAYLKMGNNKLAAYNYRKSVDLDPGNENGKRILEKIQE
jgi:CubicO group peptidase (beta-lactamase class C family)